MLSGTDQAGTAGHPYSGAARAVVRSRAASAAQRRLWLLDRGGRAGSGYMASLVVPLAGALDEQALGAALDALAARHEPLRTVYREVDGEPTQRILPPGPVRLTRRDLAADGHLAALAAEERRLPVDLADGPVFRAVLAMRGGATVGLVLLVHHIAFDGWSIGILATELGALYRAAAAGRSAGLAPLQASYADLAERLLARQDGAAEARDLAFWRERLAGLQPPGLDLEPPPHASGGDAVRVPLRVTAPVLARIDRLAARLDTTRATVLLALFLALVGRVSGSRRPAVGMPVSGREDSEAEALVGFFVDTVVVDAELSDRPSLSQLVSRLRRRVLDAFDHRSVAFERVAETLEAECGAAGPLFDVAFGLQQAPAAPDFGPGVAAGPMSVDLGVRFALEAYLWPEADGLAGVILADGRRASPAAVEDFRRWFLVLTARALAEPDMPLDRLALTTPEERERVVRGWNATATPLPEGSIGDLVAAAAARDPAAPAIRDGGRMVSYRALVAEADAIAAGLSRSGVRAGSVVGVLAERSAETVALLLAILKRGAAYLMLDPGQPLPRLEEILSDAAPALVVTTQAQPPVLSRPVVPVADLSASGRDGGPTADATVPPEAVAYVNYTSGSTGRPKGIAIPHQAVVRLAVGQDWLPLGPGDVVAHVSNLAFDAATFELWSTLVAGACLAVIPADRAADPSRLISALRENRIGAVFLTTALFNQVIDHDPHGFAGLGDVLFGGEAVDPRRVDALFAGSPPERLWHVYGPTETTTFASRWRIAGPGPTLPIGVPLANTGLYVLDAEGHPVPPGGTGELNVGGPGLAHGYPGDPAATADRFRPDPFSGRPGARLYRTGDRVRLGRDGAILFRGRMDRQVKIRGFRVEPAEIEAALSAIDGVGAAVVLVDERGERRLVAHVATALPEAEIRTALKGRLPGYMIPAVIAIHAALPTTRVGKIDRTRLASLEVDAAARPVRAASNPVEAAVAGLMAEVLGREAVDPDDDFFDLGGHSLAATRLAGRLRAVFRIEIGLTDLFDATTAAGIARLVAGRLGAGAAGAPLLEAGRAADAADETHPLSFAQSRLWFLDRLGLTGAAYHSPLAFRLAGPVDAAALEAAIGDLVARHEPLRTVFEEVDGLPRQRVRDAGPVVLERIDLTGAADPRAAIAAAVDAAVAGWFDLEADVLLRAQLLTLGPDDHVLVLVFHHVAFDGWSLPIAIDELGRLYGARRAGEPHDLAPLPVRYADFARWQRARFDGPAGEALVKRAVRRLAGLPELDLPTDRPRGRFPGHRGARLDIHWDGALADRLLDFARRRRATLSMLLLAGFTALMQRWTGNRHVVVGSPIAGRTEAAVHGLIGFFVNSLVLATDLGGDPDFEEVVARVRATALEAYAMQDLPFEKLVEALRPDRDLARHPLFQVVFVLQDEAAMQPKPEFDGLRATLLPPGEIHVRFELEVHLFRAEDGIRGYIFYDRDLFAAETIRALESQLAVLLDAGTRDPATRLSALPLAGADEAAAYDQWSRA